jgi:hypothetical protein
MQPRVKIVDATNKQPTLKDRRMFCRTFLPYGAKVPVLAAMFKTRELTLAPVGARVQAWTPGASWPVCATYSV